MPPISILPSAKPHPFAGQNIKAFENILKTIGQAETLRRQRLLQSDVLKVISGGGDPQQMMSDIANVLTSQMQPNYSSGFPGLAQRIGGLFATPTMGLEDVLSGEMMKSAIVSPREQAMTEYYKARTKEAGKPPKAKPITGASMERYNKTMDVAIEELKKGDVGGFDWTKDNLLKAWENFKTSSGYSDIPDNQKKQLWASWNNKIRRLNLKTNKIRRKLGIKTKGEYEWDPNDPDMIAASGLGDYDYDAARKAGFGPDETGHWPSQFKSDTSPERYIDGLDTKSAPLRDIIATYTKLAREELGAGATPEQIAKKAKELAKSKGWKLE